MKEINDLKDLFYQQLQLLYGAETMLISALPEMVTTATNTQLKELLSGHLEETRSHRAAVAGMCDVLSIGSLPSENKGIRGMLDEETWIVSRNATPEARDAALLACAQKIEHYEIASYGAAAYYAEMLGYDDVAQQLRKILAEEQLADTRLNDLAKELLNLKANLPGGERPSGMARMA